MAEIGVIHLVRHGQTIHNPQVRFRGQRELPLSRTGRREALAAAHALADARLTAVYASPLGRAMEVGTAIAAAAGLDDVEAVEELINLDYGRWEGLTREEARDLDPDAWHLYLTDPEHARAPGGESLTAAADRIVRGLRSLGARHAGETIAAVSHGVMLRLAVLRIAGKPITTNWQFALPQDGSLTFEIEDGEIRLVTEIADQASPYAGGE
jgi:broad specificity phosphatase PhoE